LGDALLALEGVWCKCYVAQSDRRVRRQDRYPPSS
jgi:hypothetical protein